jgi:hypothetical protein
MVFSFLAGSTSLFIVKQRHQGSAQPDADHHHSLCSFLGFFCSGVFVVVEGHAVIPGVSRHHPQMCSQPGCDGLLILGDWYCQSLDLLAP